MKKDLADVKEDVAGVKKDLSDVKHRVTGLELHAEQTKKNTEIIIESQIAYQSINEKQHNQIINTIETECQIMTSAIKHIAKEMAVQKIDRILQGS